MTRTLLWLGFALAACEGDANRQVRAEAETMVAAVRLLRAADNADKGPRLAELRERPCTAEDICLLKQECVSAYELYVKGLDSVRKVKLALASDGGLETAKQSAGLLDSAEKDVEKGRELATACQKREAKVAVAYKVR